MSDNTYYDVYRNPNEKTIMKSKKSLALCEKLLNYKKDSSFTSTNYGTANEVRHLTVTLKSRKPMVEILSDDKEVNDWAIDEIVLRICESVFIQFTAKPAVWKIDADGRTLTIRADITNIQK